LAERAGLSSTPCWKRVKEMESSGIIRGYTALVDRGALGWTTEALLEVCSTVSRAAADPRSVGAPSPAVGVGGPPPLLLGSPGTPPGETTKRPRQGPKASSRVVSE
jgi:hypothetical protein